MKTNKLILLISILVLFSSCFKDEDVEKRKNNGITSGLYVLCEGTGSDNNSTLTFFDFKDSVSINDFFSGGLGKNANDMIKLDNKLYIVVTESACVWVVDMKTGQQITRISITDNDGNNRKPRHLTSYDGYVYVSCWDGNVVKINSSTNTIVSTCAVQGRYPEGIAVANGKIYVANSGGLDFPNYDKTVSVIDLNSFSFEKNLTVMENPQTLKAHNGKVYVLSTGNYMTTPQLTVIKNAEIEQTISINMADFDFWQDRLYFFYTSPYASPTTNNDFNFAYLDINNLDATPTVLHQKTLPNMMMPYHINIINNTVFVTDAKNFTNSGEVFALTTEGELLYRFSTLINPSKIIEKLD